MKRAFTLIELLVVIAIIAILAAILFPVFAQAKVAAKKTACLSGAKQMVTSALMYSADADDLNVLVMTTSSYSVVPPNADETNFNLLQPYMKNLQILSSPGDSAGVSQRDTVGTPVPSASVAANYRAAQLNYNLGLKANYGYNTQYFSVMGFDPTLPTQFKASGTNHSLVGNPAETIYMINSVWDRSSGGTPIGGGNWALDMPCRRYSDLTDSLPALPGGATGRWWFGGWNPASPNAWNVFGGAWAWHSGIANINFADGHAKGMRMSQTTQGCDVQNAWAGLIFDKEKYLWDLN